MAAGLSVHLLPVPHSVQGPLAVDGGLGLGGRALEAGKPVGRVVVVGLAVCLVVQLVLQERVVHAIITVSEAHHKGAVGAQVAELDRAAQAVVPRVYGACVVQIA